jgi:FkbM family methyltransferase
VLIKNAFIILKEDGIRKFFVAAYYRFLIMFYNMIPLKRYLKRSIYNYRMYLDVKDAGISRSLLLYAQRELDHKFMLEEIVTPGMNIFDIGANIGYYVIMERKLLGAHGSVTAIEPSPRNTDLLKKNMSLNNINDVSVYTMAISDTVEKKDFYLAKQTNLNTFHATGSGKTHLSGQVISVDTMTVPGLSKKINVKPDLIRMDVEGHEVEVINGMIDAIDNDEIKPSIIFETHLTRYTEDHDFSSVLKKLFDRGYKTKIVSSSSQRGTKLLNNLGYQSYKSVASDNVVRDLYKNIKDHDAIDLICRTGGIRTVYLECVD